MSGIEGRYESCPKCHGGCLEDGLNGPVSCTSCAGDGWTIRRDERGRFAAAVPATTEEDR